MIAEYALVKAEYRKSVDLCEYEDTIIDGVEAYLPNAAVTVHSDECAISLPDNEDVSPSTARKIGRKIAKDPAF